MYYFDSKFYADSNGAIGFLLKCVIQKKAIFGLKKSQFVVL